MDKLIIVVEVPSDTTIEQVEYIRTRLSDLMMELSGRVNKISLEQSVFESE